VFSGVSTADGAAVDAEPAARSVAILIVVAVGSAALAADGVATVACLADNIVASAGDDAVAGVWAVIATV
jgi:hypothetical protein